MQNLKGIQQAIKLARDEINADLAISQFAILIELARKGRPMTQSELSTAVNLELNTISRNCKTLGTYMRSVKGGHEKAGYGLVRLMPDIYETRKLAAELTKKGRVIMMRMDKLLGD